MEFKEAVRIWKRMCDSIENGDCSECPLNEASNRICYNWVRKCPDEAEAILAKWAAEHPEKTIADDFFEKFPKAPRDDTNNPYPCAKDCGYSKPPYCKRVPVNCDSCWRRPLEEVEG